MIFFSNSIGQPSAGIIGEHLDADGGFATGRSGKLHFGTSNPNNNGSISTRLLIDEVGNVGINTTSPAYKLDVNGDVNSEVKYIKLTKTTDPQLTQGTAVNLTWETQQVYDTDVFTHTAGAASVTVDKAGVYMIIANVNYYSTGADRSTIITTIATSAGIETGSSAQTYIRNNSGNSYANGRAQTMVSLSPGDIIYVNVYPQVIDASAATYVQGVRSELLIYRMGY